MHARLGHREEVEALFAELGDRVFTGRATELVTGAREGLTNMRLHPELAYRCGPTLDKDTPLLGANERLDPAELGEETLVSAWCETVFGEDVNHETGEREREREREEVVVVSGV